MKTVSLIIPYYNRAAFLPRTLQSVLRQTYRPLELLLVDNGSTDGSRPLAEAFAQKHSEKDFTVCLLSEPELGAARARNTGLKVATGEYCYFFDSDDIFSSDFLSDAVRTMERTGSDVAGCFTTMVWPDGRRKERRYVKRPTVVDQILSAQLSTQSVFWRTGYARSLGGWNEALPLWNDWEMGVRLMLSQPKMAWISNDNYHLILQHDVSLTGHSLAARADGVVLALQAVRQQIRRAEQEPGRLSAALTMRCAIVAGQVAREGNVAGARRIRSVMDDTPLSVLVSKVSAFLYRYARCGGRAAWRLARWATRISALSNVSNRLP